MNHVDDFGAMGHIIFSAMGSILLTLAWLTKALLAKHAVVLRGQDSHSERDVRRR